MIGIKTGGKGVDGSSYYINSAGMDDYYLSDDLQKQKEPIGVWFDPSKQLPTGKDGKIETGELVTKNDFRMLCRGRNPHGEQLLKKTVDEDHTSLYDITFNAPKSLSIIWAMAQIKNPELADKISALQRQAVEKAILFASEKYTYARDTINGERVYLKASLSGALWEHGSSRANDPQLHTHFTALNLALIPSGVYKTIEKKWIVKNQVAIAAIYHNELSHLLSSELGFNCIVPDEANVFEVAGVTQDIIDNFSKRSSAINSATSSQSHAVRDKVAIETRNAKSELTRTELLQAWEKEVSNLGLSPDQILAMAKITPHTDRPLQQDDLEAISEVAKTILTASTSVFSEARVYGAVSLITQGQLSSDQLCQTVNHMIDNELVFLGHDKEQKCYSTEEMIALEAKMVDQAKTLTPEHMLSVEAVETELAQHLTMSEEQKEAVRHATLKPDQVSIIEGAAGAGKSFTLGTVKKLYEAAGYKVEGIALSWSASNVMSNEAKIKDARAIEGFCRDIANGRIKLTNKTLLVIDEAGLVGSRHFSAIIDAVAAAGAKLIPTGDSRQLLPVAAGGALEALVHEIGSARIDTVRRQGGHVRDNPAAYASYQPMRDAVNQLSSGDSVPALNLYESLGAINITDNRDTQMMAAVEAWKKDRENNPEQSRLILANDNATVRELNGQIRSYLQERGEISSEGVTLPTTDLRKSYQAEFSVGDAIMFRANDKRLGIQGDGTREQGIYNRTQGTITAIEERNGVPHMTIALNDGGHVNIECGPGGYWDKKTKAVPIQHAYATTIYASQGMTVHNVYLLDSARMDARLAYVGASRHMQSLQVFADKSALHDEMMARRASDEYIPKEEVSRQDLLKQMAKQWGKPTEKTTTTEFIREQQNRLQPQTPAVSRFEQLDAEQIRVKRDQLANAQAEIKLPPVKPVHSNNETITKAKTEANAMQEHNARYKKTQADMQSAKNVDLPKFAELQLGLKPIHDTASSYKIKIGEGEHWLLFRSKAGNWLAHDPHGERTFDAVGFVQEITGSSFKKSLAMLNNVSETSYEAPQNAPKERSQRPVELRPQNAIASRSALAYALERGISRETLHQAKEQGFCRSDDRGIAFIGYDEQGRARCAETRALKAVEVKPGSWTTKVSAPGTDKTYSPILRGQNPADVHVVEGGFDALALHDMYRAEGRPTPTVITTLGAKLTKFVDSPLVQQALENAEQITVWREHEKNADVQAKTDKGHTKQIDAIREHLQEQRIDAELKEGMPPSSTKDLADWNLQRQQGRAVEQAKMQQIENDQNQGLTLR